MSPEDLDRIERELAISLPREYRSAMSPFPVAECTGNADRDLWDNVEELIQWNRSLRSGSFCAPWPARMFSLGSAGANSCYAIDLEVERAPVWWVDHFHFNAKGSGIVSPSFETWLDDHVRELRRDALADGIDPHHRAIESALGRRVSILRNLIRLMLLVVIMLIAWGLSRCSPHS